MKIKFKNLALIFVTFCDYRLISGGTNKTILDQVNYAQQFYDVVCLFPYRKRNGKNRRDTWVIRKNNKFIGVVSTAVACEIISSIGDSLAGFYIHHTMGLDLSEVLRFTNCTTVEINYYIHDYSSICSSPQMINSDGVYCGKVHPDSQCFSCELQRDSLHNYSDYFDFFEKLGKRLAPIAPSQFAAKIWSNAFCNLECQPARVIPHLEFKEILSRTPVSKQILRLAFVGEELPAKGYQLWEKLADSPISDRYELYHFGSEKTHRENVVHIPVDFHESETAMTDALLKHDIDVAFLCSIWPETYSFTFFECLSAQTYIISRAESGNIQCQIEKYHCGETFSSEDEILNLLENSVSFYKTVYKYRMSLRCRPMFATSGGFLKQAKVGKSHPGSVVSVKTNVIKSASYSMQRKIRTLKKTLRQLCLKCMHHTFLRKS